MKRDTKKIIVVTAVLLLVIMLSGIYDALPGAKKDGTAETDNYSSESVLSGDMQGSKDASDEMSIESDKSLGKRHLRDVNTLYKDNGDSYVTMYLTLRRGNATEGTDHTWEEVNSYSAYYYDEQGIDRYKVEGLLQVGDETGPLPGKLGYGKNTPNATVQIRGQTSSQNPQKNYKIELKKNQGSWEGQTTIALNKHMTDGIRFRNKLGFDLLSGIDQLMSLRTTFVHLYVNDLTDGIDNGFDDYGLYTQVEQLNKGALRAHGLDKTGHLYKINEFEFYRYEDVIKPADDPAYDRKQFEKLLEIKGDNDHSKLIAMLDELNDYTIPIDEIIEKYFDSENLCYWMAFNILTGNADTKGRNVYLYSAQNQNRWYLYPWDLDGVFKLDENRLRNTVDYESWEKGVSNYWGNVLFRRCLKSEEFRKQLDDAVEDLHMYLSEDRLTGMINRYRSVIDSFLYRYPDDAYAPFVYEDYTGIAAKLPSLVETYYEAYRESLEKPLPFFIGKPEIGEGVINFTWDVSYDFNNEEITYTAILAKNPDGTEALGSYTGKWTETSMAFPGPGQYFLKIYASNERGLTQDAFNYYIVESDENYVKHYGTLCFYINEDYSVSVYEAEG